MAEHTILVAFTVDADTREAAHSGLVSALPGVGALGPVTSWWVAEDDRTDGSDCDSAVFVPRGSQTDLREHISDYFDAHRDFWTATGYPYAETDVSGIWFRKD